MPPRRIIGNHAQLAKTRKIRIILDLKMGARNPYVEAVSQLLFGLLHTIKYHAGRTLTDGMYMEIKVFFIEFFQKIHDLLRTHGGIPQCPGVRIRRDHCPGMEL